MSKRSQTPTFLLGLPLQVSSQQAKHLRAHFEAARCLYNAVLGEAMKRLRLMRADPRWQEARQATVKRERNALFSQLRQEYGFSEYALHAYSTGVRTSWITDHLGSNTAQKLATRAYQAANRVCLGQAGRVRFKSKGRRPDSVEGKSNKTGMRFVLQAPEEGNAGWFVRHLDRLPALSDWNDPVVKYGLDHPIKYVRLIRRKASSQRTCGADCEGYLYCAQLVLEGVSYQKPKHRTGTAIVGLDLGPSTIAIVPQEGEARLLPFCSELKPDKQKQRRLQRRFDRQRRANNQENYDHKGRVKKGRHRWKDSHGYQAKRRRLATQARKLAAHRKSLHGHLVHEIVDCGTTITTEKLSYKAGRNSMARA